MGLIQHLRHWLFLLCQSRAGQCIDASPPLPGPAPEGEEAKALQRGRPQR